MLDRTRPYILSGKVDQDFGAVTLTVERADRLERPDINRKKPINPD